MNDATESAPSFDPVWDEVYGRNEQLNRYPVDGVVSFIFRNRARLARDATLRVVEVGCGACNNLWFAAREGCAVAGIDASKAAIEFGRARFAADCLEGDLRVGDFSALPFGDNAFDVALNRAALTQTGFSIAKRAVGEIARVLRPGGLFYNELYGSRTTARGRSGPDRVTLDISGRLAGVGQICFYDEKRIAELFADGWTIRTLDHLEIANRLVDPPDVVGNWTVIAERLP